jgi:HrpA-like RNA helicase
MIDEVHERDIDTDFLLVLLRDLLKSKPDLRIVLMSATLDAESFGRYFSSTGDNMVPVMSVPTKPRHPVEVIHLEDMACEKATTTTSMTPSRNIQNLARSLLQMHDQQLQFELEEAIAEEAAATRVEARSIAEDDGILDDEESSDSEYDDSVNKNDNDITQSLSPPSRLQALREAVSMRKENINILKVKRQTPKKKKEIGEITTKLLAKLAQHVAQEETDARRKGSILCFLPGLDEIKEAQAILEEECNSSLRAMIQILPLHSTIPQEDQLKVFIPAPDGTVKIILATNIAESSVTINDVLAVVDGGLVREMNYDAEKSMSMMETVATSKASATQRLGRAGRVAVGKCYRIYSRGQHAAMLERQKPEIQRTSLDATCLNTCTMTSDRVETFLGRAMDPPKEDAVTNSMEKLRKLGAITVDPLSNTDGGETLSPLGQCLSRLPLDPAIGRMLIMGCLMGCLDPVLTAAASFSGRDIFYTPPGLREEQRRVRQSFSESSDLVATVSAYNDYQDVFNDEGRFGARQWASDQFIGINAITSIHSVRSQLINELNRIGLVHTSDIVRSRGKNKELRPDASVNRNVGSDLLHSAVWSCGLPDNLAAHRQLGQRGTLRTRTESHTGIHPSSVTFQPPKERQRHNKVSAWIFYREMVLTSQVFLRSCTALTPEQMLLFGGYGLDSNQRVLDDWIIIESSCDDTLNILTSARMELNAALELKVMEPKRPLPEKQQEIIDAICDCFVELENAKQQQEQIPEAYRRNQY